MIELDNDLQSRQNARELVRNAKKAQAMLATFSQQQIDAIVKNVAQEAAHHAEALAKMAAEETGFGNWQDKVLKNRFASLRVYDAIKDMKTVGIIHDDPVKKVMDVGVPLGVICALVPSTNPTSTVIYKALIALKAGNAIIFSPHPGARQCSWKAIEIVKRAAEAAGAPEGCVDGITQLTLEATSELMHSKDVSLILATGGEGMVRAAYASGTPTISGGPGNGPAFIERSADIHHAVKDIITSKTFDNGVICASEQSIIVEGCIYDEVHRELEAQGAYFMNEDEAAKMAALLLRPNGTINPKVVGKTALYLSQMAGFCVPASTKVLIAEQTTGDGVTATVPLLWVVMICATFARPNGLFIAHFGWPRNRVAKAMRYYLMSIGLIVPLIMALIMFDNLNDREFSASLGRLCFLLICGALAVVTLSLKHAGIPLYLDKEGNGDNMVNRLLWNLMLGAPLVAMLAAAVGYLATAQALLARLETSVAIWFLLLVVYHIIRRWMLIQRRRLAFDRARHRRAEILAQRARGEDEPVHVSSPEGSVETEVSEVDLDAISTQSLRLVRSLLMLIALLSVIVLWSEIHSAFGFLENISLWDVTSTVQGVESLEPITLGAVLIAILVLIITTQLVRNLPALLELAILQHLDLTPGTGYAITTITKYLLMLVGGLVGFSMIGIEWSKLQWLVAALGVGLGFGLQEIFANFISGLIILFEKPIRIGDTVTIRDLTGSVTRINTRATTISDWDRKEIIVPNKAFITEQFINWSLSDSVTRVVLTVPAPVDADTDEVTKILIAAAHRCSLVIDTPAPEAFLVDLQQGIQIFELRIFAAEMGHRMPLRHEMHQLILAGFREHGIDMPFPPFQMRLESIDGRQSSKTMTSAGKTSRRTAGSL